jgi:hypothetical protein
VPGKEAASWRWVGKPFLKGINHAGSLASGGSTFENFYPHGPPPGDDKLRDLLGYANPKRVVGYSGHVPNVANQSWRATGFGFAGPSVPKFSMTPVLEHVRQQPISGYSGHVRGLVARNIVGRSFTDTVEEAKNSTLADEADYMARQ